MEIAQISPCNNSHWMIDYSPVIERQIAGYSLRIYFTYFMIPIQYLTVNVDLNLKLSYVCLHRFTEELH